MLNATLDLLEPPYRDLAPLTRAKPSLGAIVIQRFTKPGEIAKPLLELMHRHPWTVPCFVLPVGTLTPSLLHAVWGLPILPAFVFPKDAKEKVDVKAILNAVTCRPHPPIATRVAYVVRRTNMPSLGQTLSEIWSQSSKASVIAERTVRYRIRRMTGLRRHDWERINRLITAKLEQHELPLNQMAAMVHTDGRTFRSWVDRYLGISLSTFRERAGWEWILESALNHAEKPVAALSA